MPREPLKQGAFARAGRFVPRHCVDVFEFRRRAHFEKAHVICKYARFMCRSGTEHTFRFVLRKTSIALCPAYAQRLKYGMHPPASRSKIKKTSSHMLRHFKIPPSLPETTFRSGFEKRLCFSIKDFPTSSV